jgi:hypothetical protein
VEGAETLVEVDDVDELPENFLKLVLPEANKQAILEAWKNGEQLPKTVRIVEDKEYLKVG